ncbi:hypothetical protein LTR01_009102 [Friedmanniomyces endolithicus]|uniref:Uncharacterized protein n=1 Tax=Friedmanniomyces endolithicus TaxID=329885 RepID=A0AAN6F8H7_9PEZI|nr:hypothetical protein LTR01_009102 [Friedmanniomyces endolithicus]KAK0304473.1 hypothetical protein LTR82_017186 [Friedmanniomyces endolithicus]KAK0822850.1 hypothetical protein LTR73_008987 [Friedmanniomyces endolithicus]
MYFPTSLVLPFGILATQVAGQGYQCPLMMPSDATALKFAYGVQNWLYQYYNTKGGTSASQFATFPNATTVQSNNETLGMNLATNFAGLEQQAKIGVQAIEHLAKSKDLSSPCAFTWPAGINTSVMDFFTAAYYMEATLCGTFIGLADYVQNPAAAFLMARMSAEHGIHASYLGSYINPAPFSSGSMSLTPAFTPEMVLTPGSGQAVRANVGYLGAYIPQGCLAVPAAPCGVSVLFGNLTATLSNGGMNSTGPTSSGPYGSGNGTYAPSGTGSARPSYTGPVATGAATVLGVSGIALVGNFAVVVSHLL